MADDNGGDGIDHEEVINMYEGTDRTQQEVADEIGCNQSRVSRIVNSYESGKESVSLDDFSEEERAKSIDLRAAVEGDGDLDLDLDPEEEEETWNCGDCGAEVEEGAEKCPNCGSRFNWEAV